MNNITNNNSMITVIKQNDIFVYEFLTWRFIFILDFFDNDFVTNIVTKYIVYKTIKKHAKYKINLNAYINKQKGIKNGAN